MTSHTPARFTGCPALHRGSRTVCASPHSYSQTHDLRVHRPAAEVSRLYTSAHYHAAPTAYGSVPTHQIRLEDILSLPYKGNTRVRTHTYTHTRQETKTFGGDSGTVGKEKARWANLYDPGPPLIEAEKRSILF